MSAPLAAIRTRIDEIDAQLVDLLNQRAACVLQVKQAKAEGNIDIYSPERERQIIERVAALAKGGSFPTQALERIFSNIVSATRSLIGELGVSYAGAECSLAHVAALRQFGETVRYAPEISIDEVFAKVERGDAHFGVVPARLASTGTVVRTFDLLSQSNLVVIAEAEVHEQVSLIGEAPQLTGVTKVFGDIYNTTRAAEWLRTHLGHAELRVVENTARAVALCAADREHSAVVGLDHAAEQFQLPVIARGLQSETGADSRFFIVGSKTSPQTGQDKTSILCAVEERAGALREILKPFSDRGVTLLRIESRPMRTRAWEYVFIIDLEGHAAETRVKEAVDELSSCCSFVKVLGSYPLVSRW